MTFNSNKINLTKFVMIKFGDKFKVSVTFGNIYH